MQFFRNPVSGIALAVCPRCPSALMGGSQEDKYEAAGLLLASYSAQAELCQVNVSPHHPQNYLCT